MLIAHSDGKQFENEHTVLVVEKLDSLCVDVTIQIWFFVSSLAT